MVSRDEAFLILKKWRDDPGPPLISVFREVHQAGVEEKVLSGGTAYVLAVNEASSSVIVGLSPSSAEEIDMTGATFDYSDPRSSHLVDGQWDCSLDVTLSDGSLLVFAEWPSRNDEEPLS